MDSSQHAAPIIDVPSDYGHPLRPLCYARKPPAVPGGYSNAYCTIQEGHTCPHIWELVTCWQTHNAV